MSSQSTSKYVPDGLKRSIARRLRTAKDGEWATRQLVKRHNYGQEACDDMLLDALRKLTNAEEADAALRKQIDEEA